MNTTRQNIMSDMSNLFNFMHVLIGTTEIHTLLCLTVLTVFMHTFSSGLLSGGDQNKSNQMFYNSPCKRPSIQVIRVMKWARK